MKKLNLVKLLKRIIFGIKFKDEENLLFYLMGNDALPSPLSAEDEEKFIALMNDERSKHKAKEKLIEHNLRLVVYIAKKFENTNTSIEDLISVGSIGLIKAINSFDGEKQIKIATYASRCIQNEILMYLRKNSKTNSNISLNEPIKSDGDGNELVVGDLIKCDEKDAQELAEQSHEKKMLLSLLNKMPERDQEIINLRFGLNDHEEKTQKEIAEELNISQSYISRIEKKVIDKLKKDLQKYA